MLVAAVRRHSVHLFDIVGTIYFGGLLLLLAAIHPSDIATWGRYAQAVAHGSLTLIVFGSILIGKPFTEPYAREQAPEHVWKTERFHAFDRRISAVFGAAFLSELLRSLWPVRKTPVSSSCGSRSPSCSPPRLHVRAKQASQVGPATAQAD